MNDSLQHHGILGQKWGVRRYQNADGSLTAAGRRRYHKEIKKMDRQLDRSIRTDDKIYDLRNRNRNKLSDKYDQKIERAKSSKKEKDEALALFDRQSVAVKSAIEKYNSIIRKYKDVVLSQLEDAPYVKYGQEETERIIAAYKAQKMSDLKYRGMTATKLSYALEMMRKDSQ